MFPLFRHGLLGLNARNLLYLRPYNPKKAVAFADNKMKTKAFLSARGVPTAKLYARIESREQLRHFDFAGLPEECVLKPNYGYGGEGILILKGRRNGEFLEQGKTPVPERRLREHIEDILDGKFSVNGKSDTAFFEKILVSHEGFAPFRPAGLPDVRIVVFNLVPVMAMLRVPTLQSHGKANVHMGGLGIGIDIAKGVTTHAFQYSNLIHELPHGGNPVGIPIPFWEEMLLISSRIQYITNIGYLAVDLTLDAEQGPVLLEVNARAGLMVQVANLAPLRTRLERVKGVQVSTPEKGVRMAQDLFGEKVEKRSAGDGSADRPKLGVRETIEIPARGMNIEIPVVISPAASEYSVFESDLIEELVREDLAEPVDDVGEDESETYRVKFTLGGRKIQTLVHVGTVPYASTRALIGRRDLTGFYIDPAKAVTGAPAPHRRVKVDLRATDKILLQMDQELMLLKYLKPVNLPEERLRLESDRSYSPLFLYPPLPSDIDEMEKRLIQLQTDDSPLGTLLQKKKHELLLRITLFRTRGETLKFTQASQGLFGSPHTELIASASAFLQSRTACDLPPPASELLTAEEAAERFESALSRYGLHDWQVAVRQALVADCAVGWKRLYVRKGALFSVEHADSLIAHEVETHILTAENGDRQPYDLFRRGFANYLDTQEGLATYNQNRVLSLHHEKRYGPARGVLAVAYSLEHSFVDTRRYLEEDLGYTPAKALTKVVELKRGLYDTSEPGSFTKGLVYYRGLRAIEQYVAQGGDIKRLYLGKVALEDLEVAEQVAGVKPPLIIPGFLREKA
jgi:alpha-L-glutamate ligase-like protein/uncharacterized protein (TIGR02421 family)